MKQVVTTWRRTAVASSSHERIRGIIRLVWLMGLAAPLFSFYPAKPGDGPPFYGDVGVMTTDLDIETLSDLIGGKKTFIFYFLPTCPHCRDAAPTVAALAKKYGDRLQFIGVSPGRSRLSQLQAFAEEFGFSFPVVQDAGSIFGSRNGLKGTPGYLLTDGSATPPITFMSFTPDMATVLEIAIRKYLGEDPMTVFEPDRYYGAQVCASCHRAEYLSWSLTHHAASFYSLVRAEAYDRETCLRCHTLAPGQRGGFQDMKSTPWAAEVGCEACHGPGGGHGARPGVHSPSAQSGTGRARYASLCVRCHDDQRPLDDVGAALALVRHTRDREVTAEVWKVRRRNLFEGKVPPPMLLPSGGHVGASACRSCHEEAFAGWMASGHAHALERLKPDERKTGSGCLLCHSTPGAAQGATPGDQGVQCEACHGPGEAHVQAKGGRDNVLVLKGRSPSCVVAGQCTRCHDAKNDPDFDLAQAIEQVRAAHRRP